MRNYSREVRESAIRLRVAGYSYQEICESVGIEIPKPTLHHWFRKTVLNDEGIRRLQEIRTSSIKRAQEASVAAKAVRRKEYFLEKESRNAYLLEELSSDSVQKITLATLYLAEGAKSGSPQVVFGNSDPGIITLFLSLLRESYSIDESKFRCTLQARDDQDIPGLEEFWSKTTGIPLSQFYKARVDPRSVGKISRKKEYKGVCRINYFSADLLYELMVIGSMLTRARSSAG